MIRLRIGPRDTRDHYLMATEDTNPTSVEEITPEEARGRLLRLIARQDMDEHEEIYEALERE